MTREKIPLVFHAVRYTNRIWSKSACGLETWEAGAGTTNRERVTCAKCLALLGPIPTPEPLPEPIPTPAKKPPDKTETIQGKLI